MRTLSGRCAISGSGCVAVEVAEELGPGPIAGPEQAEHRRRGHDRPRLPDAAHDRAKVVRLDDDTDALWPQPVVQEVRDLLGHPLLDLEPPGEHLDDPGDL